jgi:hypothetical protein
MAIMLPTARRKDGEELPYIPCGIFKIRLPLVHWGIEPSELVQAMVMFVTALGIIQVMKDVFNMPFELALTIVCFHELMYCLHQLLGDPLVPGWITPALPLVIAFLMKFSFGVERIQALIALQVSLGILYFILGVTGLAKKLIDITPKAIQSGILLGAGVSALIGTYVFDPKGSGIVKYPLSIIVGGLCAFYLLYSKGFAEKLRSGEIDARHFLAKVANYGIMPGIAVGIIVGWISGELPLPVFEKGIFFIPQIHGVISHYSVFGVGFPRADIWLKAIPMTLVAYIIAFGNMILGQTVLEDANKNYRQDEKLDANPNRLNIICAIRNILGGLFFPHAGLGGPIWAAMQVTVTERYKNGRKAMDSIFSGSGTFDLFKFISCLILPLVCIFKPALPVALSLTMLIQGFACVYIAMNLVKSDVERGIAGVCGGALAVCGAAIGLAVGIVLCLVLLGPSAFKPEEKKTEVGTLDMAESSVKA